MSKTPPANARGLVLATCYVGFVSLGLPDTLIGVAWPSVRETFRLQQSHIAWIFVGAGASYFLSSFFAGRLVKAMNVGVLLAISSALVAASGFDYALATAWPYFVLGSLLHGLGSGAIDAGLNHYVASHFSARHMNWLHASYSFGAMLGPVVMTATITRLDSWRLGYLLVAVTLLALSVLFIITRRRWDDPAGTASTSRADGESKHVTAAQALQNRTMWLHIAIFFVYTGLEVSVGQWSFTVLTELRSVTPEIAGLWVTIYWAGILAGRIAFGFVVDRIGIDTMIRLSTVAALCGTALFSWNPWPQAAPVALALAGIGLAVVFPCLMTRTPQRLGPGTAVHAIGFQIGAAMLGAAALPSMAGLVAQHAGLNFVGIAMVAMAAMLFILHETVLLTTR